MGSIPSPIPRPFTPGELSRFRSNVTESGSCWVWTAGRHKQGYGLFKQRGRSFRTHRIAYWLEHGEWPGELMVLHKCDNPPCVNPDHLFLGTSQDNSDDKTQKGRNPLGEDRPAAKMTEDQVRNMRQRYREGSATLQQLYAEMKDVVSAAGVYYAISGRTWKHIT